MRIRTTDVSGHAVLYRPAVSWLTWHLSITSAQFIDTQMNKVGHMSPHASIFLLTQCSILAFTSCSNFLFTPRPYNTSKPQTDPRKGKHIVREPRLRGIQKQTNKKKIHFTDPADYSCYIMCVPSSPLFFFSLSSLFVGTHYRCAASSLVKTGESLIFWHL